MNNNDLLLDQILEGAYAIAPSDLSDAEKFSLFTAEQTLKNYSLSTDQLVEGLTDGARDGGIDSFYAFAGGALVEEDFDTDSLKRGFSLEVYIFQDKTSRGFDESVFDKWGNSLPELLNAASAVDVARYSDKLLEKMNVFRDFLAKTLRKFPQIEITMVHSSKGSTERIDPAVIDRANTIEDTVKSVMGSRSIAKVKFQGSQELIDYQRTESARILEMDVISQAAKTGTNSYAALVPIKSYFKFMKDPTGNLQRWLFDSNVRDYEGNVEVNTAIQNTLTKETTDESPDFWWLNNGITILASRIENQPGRFTIEDPQVVNGLQTSMSIFDFFDKAESDLEDDRLVLVKLIETSEENVRNEVIVASNSQTKLLPTAIKAVERFQKDIEDYFVLQGFFYERKKNYYKNQGKPADQTFAFPYVGQAMIAIGFSEPDQARARPSTLLKQKADYERIFDNQIDLRTYLWVARVHREVQRYIKGAGPDQDFKNNMPFYVSMLVGAHLVGSVVYHPSQLSPITTTIPDIASIGPEIVERLQTMITNYSQQHTEKSIDKIAKSKDFRKYVIEQIAAS